MAAVLATQEMFLTSQGARMAGLTDTGQAVAAWVSGQDTLRRVSHRMSELGLDVLTIRGDDDRARGLISREMIIACMAAGGDPNVVTASDIAQCRPPAGQAETTADGGQVSATGAGTRYSHATAVEQVPDYALLAAFRSLPAESQCLIYLADVTGLSYQQIAGVLGLPAEAVAARLHLTRQRLRRGFCPSTATACT